MNEKIKELKCGMVSIVGRPNVGKSTLVNKILGTKISIVSKVPQTTRYQIRGIYNDDRGQIVFIDTPGLHRGRDKLDQSMNQIIDGSMQEVDCIIYLVDTTRRVGPEEESIAQKVNTVSCPVILGLNKVDLKSADIPGYIAFWEGVKNKKVTEMKDFFLIALSSKEGINIDKLIDLVFDVLPKGPLLYPKDTITDMPQNLVIAEIIREKLLVLMHEEVPHSIAVVVESVQPRKGKTLYIKALILVERETHKEIVIGKRGATLKTAGTQAREELEVLLGSKVFLECFVKTKANWRDDPSVIQDLGYSF